MYATATKQAMGEEVVEESDISTDMLQGRVQGTGSTNSFKNFKVKIEGSLKTASEPASEEAPSTKAKESITAHGGGINPIEQPKIQVVASEEESGLRMAAHAAAKQGKKKFQFLGKTLPVTVKKEEVEELEEKNESHTHAAHYENEKGEWTGMNLFAAKDDDDAIKQAHAKCKEGCKLSRVERHIPVKEDVIVTESKDAHMDAGVGSQPDFAQNANTTSSPALMRVKDMAKNEMLGKAPGNN